MSDGSQPALSPASEEDAGDEDRSRQPLSRLIDRLAARKASDRLTLTLLVAWFQDRATLALLMIFGILNMLPNPPGSSMILGMPSRSTGAVYQKAEPLVSDAFSASVSSVSNRSMSSGALTGPS